MLNWRGYGLRLWNAPDQVKWMTAIFQLFKKRSDCAIFTIINKMTVCDCFYRNGENHVFYFTYGIERTLQ